jgi:hypothetical protein
MFSNTIPVEYVPAARGDTFVPLKDVAAEFSICTKTLKAWTHRPEVGFPPAVNIRGRWFFSRKALEEWKVAAASAAAGRPG